MFLLMNINVPIFVGNPSLCPCADAHQCEKKTGEIYELEQEHHYRIR